MNIVYAAINDKDGVPIDDVARGTPITCNAFGQFVPTTRDNDNIVGVAMTSSNADGSIQIQLWPQNVIIDDSEPEQAIVIENSSNSNSRKFRL
jgi:hypothetical protein